MTTTKRLDRPRIALVGLSFGAEFVPIYQRHPAVASTVICDTDTRVLDEIGDRFQVDDRYTSLEQVLADPSIDAVHLVTPLHQHADHTVAAMQAGKHVACTVPMALSLDDLQRIIDCQATTGRSYMMMETAVYTREFLFAQDLLHRGELGTISYAHGAHFQDMTGWPPYWNGLPPMYYMTHAVSPLLSLLHTRASSVRCVGGGSLGSAAEDRYGNQFAVESAVFTLEDCDVVLDVVRSLLRVARPYTESFSIYGDRAGFEWPQLDEKQPALLFRLGDAVEGRGRPISVNEVAVPDRPDLLPDEIAPFTQRSVYDSGSHLSFIQGGGHGGSHPHLVHEFVSSLVEGRPPVIDHRTAANWTAAGICAHRSAMNGGEVVVVPGF